VDIDETKSFIIDLNEEDKMQPLSFSHLAGNLSKATERKRRKPEARATSEPIDQVTARKSS